MTKLLDLVLALTISAATVTNLSDQALAQSATDQSSGARMKAIEDQINSLQRELEQVKSSLGETDQQLQDSQKRAMRAEVNAPKAQDEVKAMAAAAPIVTFPNGRPTIGTSNGSASLALGMQLQFDIGGYLQDSHRSSILPAAARSLNDGSNLRRGKIFVVGKFGDWTANLTPDFGGSPDGTVSLFEANINYGGFKPIVATVGCAKTSL
jgi:phosphate-selective porin OprO/OprP